MMRVVKWLIRIPCYAILAVPFIMCMAFAAGWDLTTWAFDGEPDMCRGVIRLFRRQGEWA